MSADGWAPYGAAAGAVAVSMFVIASLVMGTPPGFDAPGSEVAAYMDEKQTHIQIGSALHAAWAPLFVWFLATVASLAKACPPRAQRAASVAFGCGLVFIALFLVDVTALVVGALRPENMAESPELAAALHDVSWLAMGMAAFLVSGMLVAFAALSLRDRSIWPRWLGRLALLAAAAYALRVGTLFTTGGAFAADGVLGFWVPVVAIATWIVLASIVLTQSLGDGSDPGEPLRST